MERDDEGAGRDEPTEAQEAASQHASAHTADAAAAADASSVSAALLSARFLESCLRCAQPLRRDLMLSACGHCWHQQCCEDWRGCIACDAHASAPAISIDPRVPAKGRLTAQAASRARHLSDTNDELDRLFAPEEPAADADEVTLIEPEGTAAAAAAGAATEAQGAAILRANLGNRARARRTRAATDDAAAAAASAAALAPRPAVPASASRNGAVSSNLFRLFFNPQDVLDALFASSSSSSGSQAAGGSGSQQAQAHEEGEVDVSVLASSSDVSLKMEYLARKRRKLSELLTAARDMQSTVLEYSSNFARLRRDTETLQDKTLETQADTKRYRQQESKNARDAWKLLKEQHQLEAEIGRSVRDMVALDRADKAHKQAWIQRAQQRSNKHARGPGSSSSSRRLHAMEGLGLSPHLQGLIDAEAAADDPGEDGSAEPDDPLAAQAAETAQLAYAVPQCYTTLPDLLAELLKDLLHIDPALIYDVAARVAHNAAGVDDDEPGSAPAATARHVAGRIDLMELGLKHMGSLVTPRMLDELTKVARSYPELGAVADEIAGIESAASATAAAAAASTSSAAAASTSEATAAAAAAAPSAMDTDEEGMPVLEGIGTQALRSLAGDAPAAAAATVAAAPPSAPPAAPAAPARTLSLLHLPLPPPIDVSDALLGRVRTQGRSLQSDLHRLVYDEINTLRHSLASARQGKQRAKAVEDKALRAERTLKELTRKVDKLDAEIAQLEETLNRKAARRPTGAVAAANDPPQPTSAQRRHKRIRLDESAEDAATDDVTLLLSDEDARGVDSPERAAAAARRGGSAPSSAASSSSAPPPMPLAACFPSLYPQSFRPAVHAPSAAVASSAASSKPLRTNLLAASSSASASAAAAAAATTAALALGSVPPLIRPAPGHGGKAKLAAAFDLMSSLLPSESSGPLLASLNLSNLRAIAAQAAAAPPPPVQPPRENPFGLKTSASVASSGGGAVPHSLHASSVPSDRPLASLGGLASLSGAPALSVRDRAAANARKGKSAGGEYMVRGPDGRGGSVTVMRTEEEVRRERAKRLRAEKENGAAAAAAAATSSAAPASKLSRQSSSSSPSSSSAGPSLFSMPNLSFRAGVHGTANQHARVHKPSQSSSPAAGASAARVHTTATESAASPSAAAAATAAAGSPSTAPPPPPPALHRSTSTPAPHTLAAAFSRAAAAASTSSSVLSRSSSSRPPIRSARAAAPAASASSSAGSSTPRDVVVIDDDDDDDDEIMLSAPTAHPFFQASNKPAAATALSSLARAHSRTPFSAVQTQAK